MSCHVMFIWLGRHKRWKSDGLHAGLQRERTSVIASHTGQQGPLATGRTCRPMTSWRRKSSSGGSPGLPLSAATRLDSHSVIGSTVNACVGRGGQSHVMSLTRTLVYVAQNRWPNNTGVSTNTKRMQGAHVAAPDPRRVKAQTTFPRVDMPTERETCLKIVLDKISRPHPFHSPNLPFPTPSAAHHVHRLQQIRVRRPQQPPAAPQLAANPGRQRRRRQQQVPRPVDADRPAGLLSQSHTDQLSVARHSVCGVARVWMLLLHDCRALDADDGVASLQFWSHRPQTQCHLKKLLTQLKFEGQS